MTEIWRTVKGYEGLYEVSSKGRVRTIERLRVKPKIKATRKDKDGYLVINLFKGEYKTKKVHRLVGIAFIKGDTSLQINHKNGIKSDNSVGNLEWVTSRQNNKHNYDRLGRITHLRKLTKSQVIEIRRLKKEGQTYKQLSGKFNIPVITLSRIVRRISYREF